MTYYDRLRRDWAVFFILADLQEAHELALCRAADDRARVRTINPTMAGQLWPRADCMKPPSGGTLGAMRGTLR